MTSGLQKSGPGLAKIQQDLARLRSSDVLVGIPAQKTLRKGGPINNASLMFVHTKGSPLRKIPARPVIEPSVEANSGKIAPHLGKAAQAILNQDPDAAERELKLAGTVASNGAKRWFTDPRNGWAPNAPSTIERKGSDRPLIDTGALRRAITFAIRFGR